MPLGAELARRRRKGYRLWTPDMVRAMQAHPERSAAEIAALLGVTPSSVRHARQRYGRFGGGTGMLCIACDSRPVFDTSAQAKKWRLCKGVLSGGAEKAARGRGREQPHTTGRAQTAEAGRRRLRGWPR